MTLKADVNFVAATLERVREYFEAVERADIIRIFGRYQDRRGPERGQGLFGDVLRSLAIAQDFSRFIGAEEKHNQKAANIEGEEELA